MNGLDCCALVLTAPLLRYPVLCLLGGCNQNDNAPRVASKIPHEVYASLAAGTSLMFWSGPAPAWICCWVYVVLLCHAHALSLSPSLRRLPFAFLTDLDENRKESSWEMPHAIRHVDPVEAAIWRTKVR